MSTWERLARLPVRIEESTLEPLQVDVSSAFQRKSTLIHLHGDGQEGVGEDVTYDATDHEILQDLRSFRQKFVRPFQTLFRGAHIQICWRGLQLFQIESVHLGRTTDHVDEDHTLGRSTRAHLFGGRGP